MIQLNVEVIQEQHRDMQLKVCRLDLTEDTTTGRTGRVKKFKNSF